jgi:hypothetical protein
LTRARAGHLRDMDVHADDQVESRFDKEQPQPAQSEERERRGLTQRELVRASLLRVPPQEPAEAPRR